MAIYHCSLRIFARSNGHSAVAAAAYRAGAVLKDQRTGKIHRYGKRKGVLDAFILAPPSTPQKLLDRAVLWNAAEASETRKNSRVAREVILALPHELSDADRQSLCRDMAGWLVERYRVAVDTAIHSPVQGDGHDGRNHHAHLLFTTRELGPDGLGKKTRILDDKEHGPKEVEIIREVWETLANEALKRAGFEGVQIDRRTLGDQGIDRVPQTHVGKAANHAGDGGADRLKSHFAAQNDTQAKDEDADEDEDSDSGKTGKTDTGKAGKAGSGEKALTLKSEIKEDKSARPVDYKVIDQGRTRLDFNEEIKKLNERRAAFSNVSLKEQITYVEKLMGLLESREKHLKTLLTRATLPNLLRQTIETFITSFKEAFLICDRERASVQFSAQEKTARTERQLERYSKAYRAGLHEQIKEMKTDLDRLEQKQREYQSFKNFIDKIETEIRRAPQIVFEQSAKTASKMITNEEHSLKIYLKAQLVREFVPPEFKPHKQAEEIKAQADFKKKQPSLTLYSKEQKPVFEQQSSKILAQLSQRPLPTLATSFQEKSIPTIQPKTERAITPEWKQVMPFRITALDKAIEERQSKGATAQTIQASKTVAEFSESKNWFISATEKTQPLQKSIDKVYAEHKRQEERPASSISEKFSRPDAPSQPIPKTSNEAEIEKVKQEAHETRDRVPPQYRAERYTEQHNEKAEPKSKGPTFQSEFASEAEQASSEIPRGEGPKTQAPKMSQGFNTASFNATELSEPKGPEADLKDEGNPAPET